MNTGIKIIISIIILAILAVVIGLPKNEIGNNQNMINDTSHTVVKNNESYQIEKPYRILIMGDSLVAVSGGFGEILEQKLINLNDLEVLRKGKVSSGMSRPDYFDWKKESASLIDSFSPNIAIAMMGTNDAQSFEIIKDGVKKVLVYGTPEWDAEYTNRLKVFNKQLTSNNIKVYWIGLPAMRDEGYAKKIRHVNDLNESAAKENDQVTYLSAEKLMAVNGEIYKATMPDSKGVIHNTRLDDGIHLTTFGATYLAEKIINELSKDLDL